MEKKNYFYITSFIFLVVGIIHIIRIATGFEIQIMGYVYPQWLSILEMLIAFYLMIYGYKLGKKDKKIIIRVRGVILNDDKMLVVKMPHNNFYCLPGGKLDYGEGIKECIEREIMEELGIKPEIGRLLFSNTFIEKNMNQSLEFIFEIINGKDYLNLDNVERTHAHELVDICWIEKDGDLHILPTSIDKYFRDGEILSDVTRYIKD